MRGPWRRLVPRLILAATAGYLPAAILSFFLLSAAMDRYLTERVDEDLKSLCLDLSGALDEQGPPWSEDAVTSLLERYGFTRGTGRVWLRFDQGSWRVFSDATAWQALVNMPDPGDDGDLFAFADLGNEAHEAGIRVLVFRNPLGYKLLIAQDLAESKRILATGRLYAAASVLLIVLVGTSVGWPMGSGVVKTIRHIGKVAERFSRRPDVDRRAPYPTVTEETDRLSLTFNNMMERIQGLIHGRKVMMDNIAHDIRSPVARLRASAEADISAGRNLEQAGRVIEECDTILNLVNTVLEISAAEAGIIHLNLESLSAAQVCEDAGDLFSPVAEMKGVDLNFLAESEPMIQVDRRLFQRVVSNLLDNALKFTPQGGKVRLVVREEAGNAMIEVHDNGPGIGAGDLPNIFERFYRGDGSRTSQGSGLGLSFCHAAVTAMQGSIHCRSQEGQGTTFTLAFPISA